ncbi:MAG: hypothetical protein HY422_03335 [Candidatus Komeilibacteria bacterium]|nr:hypothetical protein [Candidatus Komeilibacteria bacterium]
MAADAAQADSAIARDQAEQAWAREMRMEQFAARRSGLISADKRAPFSRARHGAQSAFEQARELQEALKQARNLRNIITLIGGLTSFTLLGVIWTFIQWNIQAIWTMFGLPGKDFFGLHPVMVGVVILFDLAVFILGLVIVFLGYAAAHPTEAFCVMAKPLLGDHWYVTLMQETLSFFGQCPKL